MTNAEIPAELLAELEAQRELLATAESVSITSERMLNQRQDEYDAARGARDDQLARYDSAVYAESIASNKLAEMCRAAGVVRTADGFRLAELVTGPASAEIDPA